MFNTNIPFYIIFIVISIISGLIIIYKNFKSLSIKKLEIIGLFLYIIVGLLFGAKCYTLITNYKESMDFLNTGLSSYGAVLGIILMIIIYSIQFKKKLTDLIYIITPSIPLMYSIGKIGCFIAGCCYGIEYDGIFSVTYYYSNSAPLGIELFPIQLIESIVFMLIFIFSIYLEKKKINKQRLIGIVLILCSISKFLLEYLRFSHINEILSNNQIVSIIFIIIGIIITIKKDE